MTGSALEIAQQRLASYLEAEAAILKSGQEKSSLTRRNREADLSEIRKAIADLKMEITGLEGSMDGGSRLYSGVPL
jgi:hypothetical protein